MRLKSLLIAACAATAISGPAMAGPLDALLGFWLFDTFSADRIEPKSTDFSNALYAGYQRLQENRSRAQDVIDAEHFNLKARTAGRRSAVAPDSYTDRRLYDHEIPVFEDAYFRLQEAFDKGARTVTPDAAATGQVSYDCWLEATEEERTADAEACFDAFNEAMQRMGQADFGVTTIAFTPVAAAPQQAVLLPQAFLVYFEFDSARVTAAGRKSLDAAVAEAVASPGYAITVIGHADRAGPSGYNLSLSGRRSQAVIDAFVRGGVDRERIRSEAVGEARPLVPTPDGVAEQGNRVVEVDLM